jgi:hypothetical protein
VDGAGVCCCPVTVAATPSAKVSSICSIEVEAP